jgi:hypothetical protein
VAPKPEPAKLASRSSWTIIRGIYDIVHTALWVLVAAWVAVFINSIPRIPEALATAERQRALEISKENKFYCEKWGMRANSHEYVICTMDLNEIRAKVEKRIAEDSAF